MEQLLKVTVAFALLAISVPAVAQQGTNGQRKETQDQREGRGVTQSSGRQGGPSMQAGSRGGQGAGGLFRLLDIDRDGNLSAKEIEGAVAVLMKLDANKDGILDAKELAVRGGGGKGKGNEGTQDGRGSRQRDEGPPRRGPGQKNDGQTNRPAGNRGESK